MARRSSISIPIFIGYGGVSKLMQQMVNNSATFKFHPTGANWKLTHLYFADDLMDFFGG